MRGDCYGLTPEDLDIIVAAITALPQIKKVILFGSRAKGNYKAGSDVDLAIEAAGDSHRVAIRLAEKLNEESPLPYLFDVIDVAGITEQPLVEHIRRVGITIYQQRDRLGCETG